MAPRFAEQNTAAESAAQWRVVYVQPCDVRRRPLRRPPKVRALVRCKLGALVSVSAVIGAGADGEAQYV